MYLIIRDLDSGDYLFNPTLLLKQTESKGIKTNSLHSFNYTPLGAVSYKDEGGAVYYQDNKGNWFKDEFTEDGIFINTKSLNLSLLLNEEALHKTDLNADDFIGDTIKEVYGSSSSLKEGDSWAFQKVGGGNTNGFISADGNFAIYKDHLGKIHLTQMVQVFLQLLKKILLMVLLNLLI